MIKRIVTAGIVGISALSFVPLAQAEDFPAAPVNTGGVALNGLGPISTIVNLGLTPPNVLAQGATPAAEPAAAPVRKRRHHRRKK